MRFRTKLLTGFMSLALASTAVTIGITYWYFTRVLRDQIGSEILTMAATTANALDGDSLKQLKPGDEKSDAYITLRDQIRRARDINRRADFYVKYIYTLSVDPASPTIIKFGVDGEEDLSKVAAIGEAYRTELTNPFDVEKPQYDKVYTKDDWGEFLTANAPIKDREGKVVGALGVDVESSQIKAKMWRVLGVELLSGAAVLLASLGAAWRLSSSLNQPLEELHATVARLKASFERYVPSKVVESIMKSPDGLALMGGRRKVTVLFSDLRGFSKTTESRRPEDVVAYLNAHFEVLTEVVERHEGTLDKFIGDGMMATFGACNEDANQEEHAILAALEMQEKIRELGRLSAGGQWPAMQMGIGINSGYAVVGNLGSSRHMEYTAIGETTNTAAYLEAKTKELGVNILISQYTYNAVRGLFQARTFGPIAMKGYAEQMTVYAVDGLKDAAPVPAPA